jgi:hypothetical protein
VRRLLSALIKALNSEPRTPLFERENLWLKSLVNNLKAVNADGILNEIEKSGNKAQLGAYLDVIIRANPEAFTEAMNMARRKRETFEEVFTRAGLIPEWLERGRIQGREEGREQGLVTAARNAISKGLPIDVIHDITGLDIETIQALQTNPYS